MFINSLSKILCSDFHLMSAFEKTTAVGISLIKAFGNVMVTLIIGSQILKAFCAVFGICARKNFKQRIF